MSQGNGSGLFNHGTNNEVQLGDRVWHQAMVSPRSYRRCLLHTRNQPAALGLGMRGRKAVGALLRGRKRSSDGLLS